MYPQGSASQANWEYHLRDVLLVKMNQLQYPPRAESSASIRPGEDKPQHDGWAAGDTSGRPYWERVEHHTPMAVSDFPKHWSTGKRNT